MQAELAQQLTRAGILDGDGFARRVCRGACGKCKQPILRGLDARTCGVPVTAQAAPIDQPGELIALVQGARTYDLVPIQRPGGVTLEPRRACHIQAPRQFRVVATHRCGLLWPPEEIIRSGQEPAAVQPPY